MASGRSPLPKDPLFPPRATDWLTGEQVGPHVVYREGKWWIDTHYQWWRRDLLSDQLKFARNQAVQKFFQGQPNAYK